MRTTSSKAGAALAAILLCLGTASLAAPAGAQEAPPSGADAVEACAPLGEVPQIGRRVCKSVEAVLWLAAGGCRRVPGTSEEACPRLDGREVSERAMTDFEASWLARALELQGDLDDHVPLVRALLPHTHNSANSTAYDPSLSTLDANQVTTITDQLRLGIRAIELDIHWTPQPDGDPANGFREVVQCHGKPVQGVHVGCSVDQPLGDRLAELAAWLEGNPEDVVLLYLENALDGDDAAHAEAVALLEAHVGDLVHRPVAGGDCQGLPAQTLSEAEVLAAGHQLVIVGNCGPSGWTDLVFDRYPHWTEDGSTTEYSCRADRSTDYGTKLVRRYEDSTWLGTMAGGGSSISPAVMADMVGCGVNLPGFDQLHAGDPRLPSLVWSWRTDEPAVDATGRCAAQDADGRFFSSGCGTRRPAACRAADGGWATTAEAVDWTSIDEACAGLGLRADTPVNGWDNAQLRRAAGTAEVWLAYAQDDRGGWALGGPGLSEPEPEPEPEPDGPGRGHGSRSDAPGPPGAAGRPLVAAPASSSSSSAGVAGGALLALAAVALLGSLRRWPRSRS